MKCQKCLKEVSEDSCVGLQFNGIVEEIYCFECWKVRNDTTKE